MRYVLTALSFLFIGCSTPEAPRFSSTHQWLRDFQKDYTRAYRAAPNDIRKEEVIEDYRQRLNSYLVGTKKYTIDSVSVRVARIGVGMAEFEGPGVYFVHYGENEVVRDLRVGQDTMLNFKYGGTIELREPSMYQAVSIEAEPIN